MKSATAEEIGELSMTDPNLYENLLRKRSEDPVFMPKPGSSIWNSITTLPEEKLKLMVRPNTIKKDLECAQHIAKRINEDEVAEKIQ